MTLLYQPGGWWHSYISPLDNDTSISARWMMTLLYHPGGWWAPCPELWPRWLCPPSSHSHFTVLKGVATVSYGVWVAPTILPKTPHRKLRRTVANTRRRPSVVPMVCQRLRRWLNIWTALSNLLHRDFFFRILQCFFSRHVLGNWREAKLTKMDNFTLLIILLVMRIMEMDGKLGWAENTARVWYSILQSIMGIIQSWKTRYNH